MELAEKISHMGQMKSAYNILVGKSEGKRPLGRPGRRMEDIRIDIRKIICEFES
jgi:hypothetical protein